MKHPCPRMDDPTLDERIDTAIWLEGQKLRRKPPEARQKGVRAVLQAISEGRVTASALTAVSGTVNVQQTLEKLERQGLITWVRRSKRDSRKFPRQITLTPAGHKVLEEGS